MAERTSFTFKLTSEQQDRLLQALAIGNYREVAVPYALTAVEMEKCRVVLYQSGKCCIQGKNAEEFVTFTMEPIVLQQVTIGYEDTHNPEATAPHMGVDESGKGDFFGPLVCVAAYIDPELGETMRKMGVKDSKRITSDDKAMAMGRELRSMLGNRYAVVKIGPPAYNRLYAKMRNVNRMLAWAHARSIENLLAQVPDCPRAISDQFGSKQQVERALMKKGRTIELIQMPKAESDLAVAAASIIARDLFLRDLLKMAETHGVEKIPKGASVQVRTMAEQIVKGKGPKILLELTKCHFKTTDQVLAATGASRADLGPEGEAVSKPKGNWNRKT